MRMGQRQRQRIERSDRAAAEAARYANEPFADNRHDPQLGVVDDDGRRDTPTIDDLINTFENYCE